MTMSLSSSLVFRKANRIDWPLAIALESMTTTGAFVGGIVSEAFSVEVLSILFALVLASTAYFMIRFQESARERPERDCPWFVWNRRLGGRQYQVNLAIGLPVSFAAGLFSGLLGVGGGILKVPMMVMLLGIPMDVAIGSSALMVGITAAGGFSGHLVQGHWNWRLSLLLAAAVFAGAQVGSRISVKVDKHRLKLFFGWFLLVVALMMAFKAIS
jgi:uncharacterized membrane protein YfcA